ncbi:MAG: VIT domain-containing protein [candidate division WOR-3 bacterium]|nr:VIT domain-containing protein [candidate division WOR-3 bacterium]MDH5684024.1 VIT domain-containing protein [candidate division WOR-3 bacterium]
MRKITLLLICAVALFADGVIIPMPPRPPWHGKTRYLTMKDHQVKINILNNICQVEVDETFYNPYDFQIEGEYIFPLPKGAMPSKFSLIVNGKEIKGEVLERDQARRIYESIVRRMQDPALLEYYEHNLFRAKVFPILAKKDVKTSIRYEYELPRKEDFYEVFYPFKIEGVSPEPIDNVVISFNIATELPIKQVFSPTHKIDVVKEEKTAKGAYEETKVKPDKDFILYYSVSRKEFDLSLLTYKKEEDGFFLLGLSTPAEPTKQEILPKDIVFVVDVSGSMSGEKIQQAKNGLNFFVQHLNPADRFNIIAFSSDINAFKNGLVLAAKNNIEEASRFIKELQAQGGTNINDALIKGLEMLGEKQPSYLLFLTDGLPTVGITKLDEIIKNAKENLERERLFVFGVGYDVNTILLDMLSKEGKGVSEYIEPAEDLEIAISSLYSKIMYPALESPNIEFKNIDVYKLHPSDLGDLFYGQDVIIAGRYKKSGNGQVILKGKKKEKAIVLEEGFNFPDKSEELDFIPLIWARKRVGNLLSEIRLHGENKELTDEVIALGKKYGIVTPYTSYLVREEERAALPLAAERPAYLRDAVSGSSGVRIAKKLGRMKSEIAETEPSLISIKQVGEKTFYLKDGIYVDAEYKEGMKTKEIKFDSSEYFELLKKYPEYARYFSISSKIIVVIKGVGYKIVEQS